VRQFRCDISDEAASQFLAHEIGVPDVVKFRALAAARDPIDSLFHATDQTPQGSARWRAVIEPLGWGDELRVALREGGQTWGALCLHRTAGEAPFDADDVIAVRRLVPGLAAAFRRMSLLSAVPSPQPWALDPGVVVLDDQLVVTATSGAATSWLDQLATTGEGIPVVLMSAAAQALTSGHPQSLATVTRHGRWLSVHASVLRGPGKDAVAVVLQPAHPGDAFPRLAAAARLTPRETEVAAAVLGGLSDRVIARRLGLSEYTVQDHLKRVYAKTGAAGRADLVARLLLR
jgi:DNA-binding CsgD family transcriptional regulator